LFARGVLATRRDAAVPFVPDAAVSTFAGITKVFVLADGKAQETSVKLGRRQDGMVEILEGVRPGQQVATSSLAQLYDGAAVTVQAHPRAKP
jgi:membrane fusion protein, multidrug efflux system